MKWISLFALAALCCGAVNAESLTATVAPPAVPNSDGFKMGAATDPDGSTIAVNTYSLLLDDKPWTPVMGEFHFARYPAGEWREELLKMKSGGIDMVATYVFWIHHEETEGAFDWSGRRDLRRFVRTAGEVGLQVVVRCGPWCHGEVRNGGLPDWVVESGWQTRSNHPDYLAAVNILYREIHDQLRGQYWKDGGPVIGIQLENEFPGAPEHLMSLKGIARKVGMDVPLYTRTGWPGMKGPMPFGEVLPLFGVYAEGFWDRAITPMPGNYRAGFHFSPLRTDGAIATDQLGERVARDEADVARYPYLTCEVGGGMMNSYHRRILIDPRDVQATTLVKLGSGSTSPGYYMYHGGVNPEGRLSTLNETQASGYWNDLPVKNYDFQAPLGQYGQVRPHYHLQRRMHLFLREWGDRLATMPAVMPDLRPSGMDDVTTLRWAVRSNGSNGFVFVNNYQRLATLPAKPGVQFHIALPDGPVTFPNQPITIPENACFFWPFSFDLGHDLMLDWATVQPICAVEDSSARTLFFAAVSDVPCMLSVEGDVKTVAPGREPALVLTAPDHTEVRIVVLSPADSLSLWKGEWRGRERVLLTPANLVLDGNAARCTALDPADLSLSVIPCPPSLQGTPDGVFTALPQKPVTAVSYTAGVEQVRSAGPLRTITNASTKSPVAEMPSDEDFEHAAVWRITLPRDLDLAFNPLLRLSYVGDVARVTLNGKLLTDDFYNGQPLDIGLRRHAPDILTGDLRIQILPLQNGAPIYLSTPDCDDPSSCVRLDRAELIPQYEAIF